MRYCISICMPIMVILMSCKSSASWCTSSSSPVVRTTTTTTTTTNRREWLKNIALTTLVTSVPFPVKATYNDPKTGIAFPEEGEIEAAIPKDWTGVENPLNDDSTTITTAPGSSSSRSSSGMLSRLDTTPDIQFYADPRFVEHVDDNAVKIMTNFIRDEALSVPGGNDVSVLDLCSSWTSHISVNEEGGGQQQQQQQKRPLSLRRVAGLGMNAKELEANPSLTDWTVKDLNEEPKLPYNDATFDVVLCQLSIDYLTQPLAVLQEVGRVLKPEGRIHILFSNRLFLQKAVALWTGADDIDHAYTVGCYLYFCDKDKKGGGGGDDGGSLFQDIHARDLSTRNRSKKIVGDPVYVVSATRSSSQ